ncbi:MAG: carboxypeptidase-like regulatory domain-containing protein [Pyrinomonadaceae bacterium MAG19_C2-C3]|nr:carboxypeptidase-like regulatory domain-containing protein [Pyrinomonadaceae bacterium MAG19_C2-C3]
MGKSKKLLERVRVPQACDASWNEMTARADTGARRLCEHCAREVHDLSEMTKAEAEDLIGNAKGRVCVRLVRDANGRVVTKDALTKDAASERFTPTLYGITRRASSIAAASAFSAALTLTNVAGQTANQARIGKVRVETDAAHNGVKSSQAKGVLVGTVHDTQPPVNSQYAVIPDAKVTLTEMRSGKIRETQTDDSGEYRFALLPAGTYRLEVLSPGFQKFIEENILITKDKKRRFDVTLEVGMIEHLEPVSFAERLFSHEGSKDKR